PGANGAKTGRDSHRKVVSLQHAKTQLPDINHSWQSASMAYDNGNMDHFHLLPGHGGPHPTTPYQNNSLTQLSQSDIPNYWKYAQNFVLGDNMFSSLMGPSFPNHLYIIAAQSGGAINNPLTDKNIGTLSNSARGWGCDVANQQVQVKTSSGSIQLAE